jgi:AcrR family transcriptional regulator
MNDARDSARERIILKAKEKFATIGYRKTSMDEIAGELGMSKKTLYKFFPTKQKLAEELLARIFAEINHRSEAILGSPLPAVEKLFRIMQMVAELQQRFATKTLIESLHHHLPYLWRRIESFRRERMRKNMQAIFEQGRREGTVGANLNRDMFLHFLIGAINEGITPEVLIHAPYSMHDALVALIDVFMNGVLTEAGREQYQKLKAATVSVQ